MSARQQVVLFLHLMNVAANEQFVFVGRRTNLETLARLGINRKHAQDLAVGLKPGDTSAARRLTTTTPAWRCGCSGFR